MKTFVTLAWQKSDLLCRKIPTLRDARIRARLLHSASRLGLALSPRLSYECAHHRLVPMG